MEIYVIVEDNFLYLLFSLKNKKINYTYNVTHILLPLAEKEFVETSIFFIEKMDVCLSDSSLETGDT